VDLPLPPEISNGRGELGVDGGPLSVQQTEFLGVVPFFPVQGRVRECGRRLFDSAKSR
jgi:hypothetical protein